MEKQAKRENKQARPFQLPQYEPQTSRFFVFLQKAIKSVINGESLKKRY
jgi:hypothetical protein